MHICFSQKLFDDRIVYLISLRDSDLRGLYRQYLSSIKISTSIDRDIEFSNFEFQTGNLILNVKFQHQVRICW